MVHVVTKAAVRATFKLARKLERAAREEHSAELEMYKVTGVFPDLNDPVEEAAKIVAPRYGVRAHNLENACNYIAHVTYERHMAALGA